MEENVVLVKGAWEAAGRVAIQVAGQAVVQMEVERVDLELMVEKVTCTQMDNVLPSHEARIRALPKRRNYIQHKHNLCYA